jgi:SSS family solute:Na+ symporter
LVGSHDKNVQFHDKSDGWTLQTFPAVVFGLFVRWFRAPALLAGWAVGLSPGSWLACSDGIKPVHRPW